MPKVLIIDDEHAIAELVRAALTDEGFSVSVLSDVNADTIRVAVNQLEPDCVLLDSESPTEYGRSWDHAAWLHTRTRPVPTIMFTAHQQAVDEAEAGESDRSRAAAFAGVLRKPFDLDAMLDLVARCTG